MKITAIQTAPIVPGGPALLELIDSYILDAPSHTIVVVSSKIIAIAEGNTIPIASVDHQELVRREADYYRSPDASPYHSSLTIKADTLIGAAGVDESNGSGHYVLWPADPQVSANRIREHLTGQHGNPVGVIITDSHSQPLRRGATGFGLAHSGFLALVRYAGQNDIFSRPFRSEAANVLDGLAAGAVALMGEGAQQTPLALIEDVDFIDFQTRNPNAAELGELRVPLEQDLYYDAFNGIKWDKRP